MNVSLDKRLGQAEWLVGVFGPDSVNFRFDPIVHYQNIGDDEIMDDLEDFEYIVKYVSLTKNQLNG